MNHIRDIKIVNCGITAPASTFTWVNIFTDL
jgi:hypothetical protein